MIKVDWLSAGVRPTYPNQAAYDWSIIKYAGVALKEDDV